MSLYACTHLLYEIGEIYQLFIDIHSNELNDTVFCPYPYLISKRIFHSNWITNDEGKGKTSTN